MMKILLGIIVLLHLTVYSFCQNKKISIETNFGINGNFWVINRDEEGGPTNKTYFYKKNFIGTIGGIELNYKIGKRSAIIGGYNRSVNSSQKNYTGSVGNVDLLIDDFTIRDYNNIFYAGFKHLLSKGKTKTFFDIGPVLIYSSTQDIMVENWDNFIYFDESNFKNNQTVEGGLFAGLQVAKEVDKHFDLGIKIRGYYLISVSTFEMITLTPTLTYRF